MIQRKVEEAMDYIEDDPRYPPKSYSLNRSKKHPLYPQRQTPTLHYNYDYDYDYDYLDVDEDGDELDDEFLDKNDSSYNPGGGYARKFQRNEEAFERYPKRQRLKNPVSNYEFAPRNPRLLAYGDGNSAVEWSEHEKFVLLEVWGDKFLQLGRNSLRSEDWVDVAEKVSETSKIERNEAQCRQMMDVLKRRYKKEKAKGGNFSKWAYFNKMDMLMKQESGTVGGFSLACGVDSGEYVFMDTRVYLDRANMNDEMRDSPCESEEEEEEEEEGGSAGNDGMKGLRVLAESVQKFGEIYGKIESSKREQMMELERMRIEFQMDLELQKKQILDRAQAEIAKIREEDDDEEDEDNSDDDDDVSGGNISK